MEKTIEIKKEDQKSIEELMNDGTQCITEKEMDLLKCIEKAAEDDDSSTYLNQKEVDSLVESIKEIRLAHEEIVDRYSLLLVDRFNECNEKNWKR